MLRFSKVYRVRVFLMYVKQLSGAECLRPVSEWPSLGLSEAELRPSGD